MGGYYENMIFYETELVENNLTIDLGQVDEQKEQAHKIPEPNTFLGLVFVICSLLLNKAYRSKLGKF